MKSIRIELEDKEYNATLKAKGDLTWKQFLLKDVELEKVWTILELEEIRQKGSELMHCYKTLDKTCQLGEVEMYDHDGGIFVDGKEEKQWVYYVCKRCNYQWAWHKILTEITIDYNKSFQ